MKSEKATEMHRLRCSDGTIENSEIQKSHSALTSAAIGNDRIDAFSSKVCKLILQYLSININILIMTHLIISDKPFRET